MFELPALNKKIISLFAQYYPYSENEIKKVFKKLKTIDKTKLALETAIRFNISLNEATNFLLQ